MKLSGVYIVLIIILFAKVNFAQEKEKKDTLIVTRTVIVDGDTIPNVSIEEVIIFPRLVFKNRYRKRKYGKLVRDVKKAYPYAKLAKDKLVAMESEFVQLETEKEKNKYIKTVEKQLMNEFGTELKKLTVTQGRILLKLIDRETGNTSYELVKELRGTISAVFWQTIARLFGSNLKAQYDPTGKDKLIERVVKLIEYGQIKVEDRSKIKQRMSQ
jgi:Domain of unknown function (DUF4294)